MSRILLRTLTLKSKLGFGKDEDLTVNEAIELGQQRELVKAYYEFSKINYSNEVLAKLNIPKDKWIDKPGKDEELGVKILKELNLDSKFQKRKIRDKLLSRFTASNN